MDAVEVQAWEKRTQCHMMLFEVVGEHGEEFLHGGADPLGLLDEAGDYFDYIIIELDLFWELQVLEQRE